MEKQQQAEKIIKEHVLWSLGAGLIPIPLVDVAAVTVVQLDMLKQLCRLYEKIYSDSEGKALLSALTGGMLARIGASALKAIPGIGSLLGGVSMTIMSGASTYAVGRVAILHFTSGGGLLDLDFNFAKKMYAEEFEKGKTYASNLEKEKPSASASPDDIIVKLEKLAQLKEKGVITEEEFEAQKQKLLERL
ncbi:MAG: SHOCT domain-containing protein [Candidatus Vecturithrix sp.]|jgi:uncharacterized protein (DUF697 family)|nr:SHOCT domain-containing protein [Candidatus Vecturithrix sp.]